MGAGFDMDLMLHQTTVNRRNDIASQQLGVRGRSLVKRQPAQLSSSACRIN